jgi:outer membrane protein W
MKKIILLTVAFFAIGSSFAQRKGGFRVGIDLGYAIPTAGGGGGIFTIEPKYNIADNMNIGLKIGGAGMIKDIKSTNGQTTTAKIGAVAFYTATFDYYFNESGNDFVPFVGAGISYNGLANVELTNTSGNSNQPTNIDTNTKLGGLLMGGFEYQHFRLAVEYNLIPESKLQSINGATIGSISNSYFGINLGFYFGGGKWRKL